MPLIAKTDGATSGEPLELREGVLTDIRPIDRANWRLVDESAAPAISDGSIDTRTVPTFTIQPDGSVKRTWEVATLPTAYAKLILRRYAKNKRKNVVDTGVKYKERPVNTSFRELSRIQTVIYALEQGTFSTIYWKFDNEDFVEVNVAEMKALHAVVAQHINDAFAVERQVSMDIASGLITNRTQIDNASWPS